MSQAVRVYFGRSHGSDLLWMVLLTIMVTTRTSLSYWKYGMEWIQSRSHLLCAIVGWMVWCQSNTQRPCCCGLNLPTCDLKFQYLSTRSALWCCALGSKQGCTNPFFSSELIELREAQMVNLLPCWSYWKRCNLQASNWALGNTLQKLLLVVVDRPKWRLVYRSCLCWRQPRYLIPITQQDTNSCV